VRAWLRRHGYGALVGAVVLILIVIGHVLLAARPAGVLDIARVYGSIALVTVLVGLLLWRETAITRQGDRARNAERNAAAALAEAEQAIASTRESLSRIAAAERRADSVARSMREAIEALSDGFALFDASDRLVLCNRVFRDLYPLSHPIEEGVPFEEMLRRGATRGQFADCDPNDPEAWIARRLRGHREPEGPFEIRLANGRWLRVLERRTSDGGYVGTRTDITELKRRELELSESEERFRRLSEAAMDGIIIHDRGIIQDASRAAGSILGYDPADIIGHHVESFLTPDHRGLIGERLSKRIESRITVHARHRDGRQILLEAENRYVSHNGRMMSMVCFRDVTEWRHAEDQLLRAKDQAEQANRAKTDFVRMISHEIRTPLNGVLGMLDLLLDGPLDGEQRTYALTARRSGAALVGIINDLLDMAKMEAGRITLEPGPFDPVELVEGVADLLAARARDRNLALVVAVAPTVPVRFVADAGRVRQILMNLAGNALKFTEAGGVAIAVKPAPGHDGSPHLLFTVADSGIGIPESARPHLFEEFSQVDPIATRRHGGAGLGLAISRRLVELLGGRIGYDSTPGEGSRFWFTLPLPADAVPEGPRLPPGVRVALGDPCAVTRAAVADLIRDCGGSVVEDDGEATVALMNGDGSGEPCARAKALQARGIRVIAVLPAGVPPPECEGVTALSRPFHRDRLLAALTGAVHGGEEPVEASVAAAPTPPPETARAILVVDDSRTNQMVASAFLRAAGYRPHPAGTATEALSLLAERPFDLVLMDITMPGMSGLDATKALRELPGAVGRIPVIAMTADASPNDRERSLAAGMNDHVSKPVDRAVLIETIERWLPPHTAGDGDGALDREVLDQLGADLDPATLAEIVGECLREQESRATRLAAPGLDLATVAAEAHTLKATAGTFGMRALAAAARELEAVARAGDQAEADRLRPGLSALVRAAAERLSAAGYVA
jgi:two-component system, sensor histidine kinase and response regulator